MVLGLTGGIASGKSSVSNFFVELGAQIVDADIIAREVANDKRILREISKEFGENAIRNNSLDREYIAEIIFTNPEKRKKINEIMHPAILLKIKTEINEKKQSGFVVADIPLLFETGLEKLMDKVAVVYIDKNTQLKRLMNRDKLNQEDAEKRIDSQMSLDEKAVRADLIINNEGSIEELKLKVEAIYDKLS